MKELSFERMKEIEGGGILGCLGAGLSGSGLIFGAAAIAAGLASGPVGWIALGIAAGSFALTVADGDPCEF